MNYAPWKNFANASRSSRARPTPGVVYEGSLFSLREQGPARVVHRRVASMFVCGSDRHGIALAACPCSYPRPNATLTAFPVRPHLPGFSFVKPHSLGALRLSCHANESWLRRPTGRRRAFSPAWPQFCYLAHSRVAPSYYVMFGAAARIFATLFMVDRRRNICLPPAETQHQEGMSSGEAPRCGGRNYQRANSPYSCCSAITEIRSLPPPRSPLSGQNIECLH
jgi:hypothetical protein